MNQEEEGGTTGSYWGRFVPLSVTLTVLGMFLQPLPFLNAMAMIGLPATLMVLYLAQVESAALRWGPALLVSIVMIPVAPGVGLIGSGMVIIAALLDLGVRQGWEWKRIGLVASGPVLLWVPIGLIWWNDVAAYTRSMLEERTAPLLEQISTLGFGPDMIAAFEETIPQTIDLTVGILPSQVAIMGLLVGFGALLAGNWWLERTDGAWKLDIPAFTTWELPSRLVWGMVAGLVISAGELASDGGGSISIIGLNVLIVVSLFYWLQGTAIVWYSFVIRDTQRLFRVLFAIAGATLLLPGLVVLGVLENWIPFRRLMAGAEGKGPEEDE